MGRRSDDRVEFVPEVTVQRVLDAVVDPMRRSILHQLHVRGRDISCGNFDLPVARSTATHHFNVLREAGLIAQYYQGTSHMNTLRRDLLDQAYPGLLDALLRAADPASAQLRAVQNE